VTRPTALVTGASSGIGRELATLAAADGHDLVISGRSAERLEAARKSIVANYGCACTTLVLDLAAPGAAVDLQRELARRKLSISVLINCAGIGARGAVDTLTLQRQREIMQVNMVALTEITLLLLPEIRQSGNGAVLNVASLAAHAPGPYMSVYYATKAYVLHFTEGLHEELRRSGVRITCLCPGPTLTAFGQSAGVQQLRAFRWTAMTAGEVAHGGWEGLKKGRAVVLVGGRNKLAALVLSAMPRLLKRRLVRQLHSPDL